MGQGVKQLFLINQIFLFWDKQKIIDVFSYESMV